MQQTRIMTEAIEKPRPVEPVSSKGKMVSDAGVRHVPPDKEIIPQHPSSDRHKGNFLNVVV